jgi:hypothetical protein
MIPLADGHVRFVQGHSKEQREQHDAEVHASWASSDDGTLKKLRLASDYPASNPDLRFSHQVSAEQKVFVHWPGGTYLQTPTAVAGGDDTAKPGGDQPL